MLWSSHEDEIICNHVRMHGQKWRMLETKLPYRSDDAIRNRWMRLTNSNKCSSLPTKTCTMGATTPRERWSEHEDSVILQSIPAHGLKQWGKIAKQLYPRTAHAIRNRWHRLQRLHEWNVNSKDNVVDGEYDCLPAIECAVRLSESPVDFDLGLVPTIPPMSNSMMPSTLHGLPSESFASSVDDNLPSPNLGGESRIRPSLASDMTIDATYAELGRVVHAL